MLARRIATLALLTRSAPLLHAQDGLPPASTFVVSAGASLRGGSDAAPALLPGREGAPRASASSSHRLRA
ncbi:MAG: hypothetical protein JWL60_1976 [Gemmatimonadetes bacterium]|jgi:hypothetical protein|nr:hypothetical protein [Gemmatimonadota bacterium]